MTQDPVATYSGTPAWRWISRLAGNLGRYPVLRRAFRRLRGGLEVVAGWPGFGAPAEALAHVVVAGARTDTSIIDVLAVADALSAAGIEFWIGGGWGIDALVGTQLRWHGDLDLVVEDLPASAEAIASAIAPLGYELVGQRVTGIWWKPYGTDFSGPTRQRIEVLGIDWETLLAAATLVRGDAGALPTRGDLRAACLGTGTLGGRPVPCLTAGAQRLFHRGYPATAADNGDLKALVVKQGGHGAAPLTMETSLVIPLLPIDGTIRQVWDGFHFGSSSPPPHISILHPFLSPDSCSVDDISLIDRVCATTSPLRFSLTSVGWFDRRVVYLAPDNVEWFINLVHRFMTDFPGLKPYGGAFGEIVPHLTLGEDGPPAKLARAARRTSRALPFDCVADELWLIGGSDEDWFLIRRFPFLGVDRSPIHGRENPGLPVS